MSALMKELFTTDIGLMSLAVVAITIGIITYIGWMFASKSGQR